MSQLPFCVSLACAALTQGLKGSQKQLQRFNLTLCWWGIRLIMCNVCLKTLLYLQIRQKYILFKTYNAELLWEKHQKLKKISDSLAECFSQIFLKLLSFFFFFFWSKRATVQKKKSPMSLCAWILSCRCNGASTDSNGQQWILNKGDKSEANNGISFKEGSHNSTNNNLYAVKIACYIQTDEGGWIFSACQKPL